MYAMTFFLTTSIMYERGGLERNKQENILIFITNKTRSPDEF